MNTNRNKKILLFLILATGIVLRLYKWNGYSFWYDEVLWMLFPQMHCWKHLLNFLICTIWIGKPPLFRFLLYFWSFLGQDEFIMRLLPFLFGVSSIVVTYKIGKKLFNEKVGLLAAFFMSLSPFNIYYSQELTHYTLTLFLCLCSIYYLVCNLEENNLAGWIKFSIITSLALYSNYICIFLVMAENIFFFFSYGKYKNLIKKWLLSQSAVLLIYLPWLLIMPKQFDLISNFPGGLTLGWIPKGSWKYIFQTLRLFNVGYNANFISQFLAMLLFFPILLFGVFSNLKKKGKEIGLLTIWLFVPMVLSILFSKINPTFTYRNFIFVMPAYYILVASGLAKFKKYLWAAIFSFILLLSFPLINYYHNIFPYPVDFYRNGVPPKKDNRGAVKYIADNFRENDFVFHSNLSTVYPYMYYFSFFKHINNDHIEELLHQGKWLTHFIIKNDEQIKKLIETGSKRIWLVFSSWQPETLPLNPGLEENKIKQKFDNNFIMLESRKFEGITVYLYKID